MAHPDQELFRELLEKKSIIEAIVRSQLGVQNCRIGHPDAWGCGGSHVAIPCRLSGGRSVYFRLPIPRAVGEACYPGNINECISTQVASYLWIDKNCPDVPIPTLYSFGFGDGTVVSWAFCFDELSTNKFSLPIHQIPHSGKDFAGM